MDKKGVGKRILIFSIILLIVVIFGFFIKAENSESPTEWRMWGKYLNHTAWDGVDFTVIPGLNYSVFHTSDYIGFFSPAIANGYVYAGAGNDAFYQLNASNVSQQIASFTEGSGGMIHSPAVAYGSVYVDWGEYFYQLNTSNISQQIANFTAGPNPFKSSPVIANGYAYIGWNNLLYQLNASNVSQHIANYTISADSLSIANGFIYVGSMSVPPIVVQLNATNISQQIVNFSYGGNDYFTIPSAVYNGYLYIPHRTNSNQANLFQLNATNISKQFANFTLGAQFDYMSPAIANGYVYIGGGAGNLGTNYIVYQLNASNISQQIANYTPEGYAYTSATVANGYVYIGAGVYMYQLNASNISKFVGKTYIGSDPYSPAYAKGYIYFGSANYNFYQVNASNLSLFTVVDTIPPNVDLAANLNVNMPGEVNLVLSLNEQGYCEYSFNVGITNSTFGYYHPTAYVFVQSFTSLAAGDYTVYAYCNDTSGNRNDTTKKSFTVTYPTSGGGQGGATPPPTTTTETITTSASPGSPAVVNVNSSNMGLTKLTVNVSQTVSNISITITKLNSTQGAELRISLGRNGALYEAYDISTTLSNSNISNVEINFKVNKTWLANQNRTANNVRLYRYVNSVWTRITTTLTGQDSQYYYFSAVSPGFSTFVVFFGEFECDPGERRCFENQVQLCLGNATWLVTEKCLGDCEDGECLETLFKFDLKILYSALGIVIVGFIVVFLSRRISRRKSKTSKETRSKFFYNQSLHKSKQLK